MSSSRPRTKFFSLALFATLLVPPACADVIVCGRRLLEGEILSENDREIVIALASGEEETVRRARIDEIVRDEDIEGYLTARVGKIDENAGEFLRLADFARRSGKKELAQSIYRKVIAVDPANRRAGQALRWRMVAGKFVDPTGLPEIASSSGDGADEHGPTLAFTVVEQIDGIRWQDWLLRHPNPAYKESIGSQLAGTLFHHGHEWGLRNGSGSKAQFDAEIVLSAKKGKTTDFFGGAHKLQVFYDAQVTIEVTRRADGVRVLWCRSAAGQGHHDDSDAARNSFLKACKNIVKNEEIAASSLWVDPAEAPEQSEILEIVEKSKKKNQPRR